MGNLLVIVPVTGLPVLAMVAVTIAVTLLLGGRGGWAALLIPSWLATPAVGIGYLILLTRALTEGQINVEGKLMAGALALVALLYSLTCFFIVRWIERNQRPDSWHTPRDGRFFEYSESYRRRPDDLDRMPP